MSGIRIGSNISSLKAQRALGESSAAVTKTYERLSSGARINRASDDAAGLAIAEGLNVKSRVYTQGARNLNDAISFLNIAQGAVQQVKTVLQRQLELATQSANGVYSDQQRQAMEKESAALGAEFGRIVDSTKFNGREVFNSPEGVIAFQGGYGTEGVYQIGLQFGDRGGDPVVMALNTTRVSTNSSGGQAADHSFGASFSADGRFLAFGSGATNLVAGATNAAGDIFIKDLVTGVTTRVATDSSGNQGSGGGSSTPSISADGRFVAFVSTATNLVAGDTNAASDVFLKDLMTGVTTRISTDSSGNQVSWGGSNPILSANGRFVTFVSDATNLVSGDTNARRDIFVKDLVTGITSRVSTNSSGIEGGQGTNGSGWTAPAPISADGRYVAFESDNTNLVAGDTNGFTDVFVKDLLTGLVTMASTNSSGSQGLPASSYTDIAISADGRYVAFSSFATNLVAGDTNGRSDVFRKDLVTGITTRVSTSSSGVQGSNSSYPTVMSDDGRFVAFASDAPNLVTGDSNGQRDAFVKDTVTGVTIRLSMTSSGTQGNNSSYPAAFTSDGRYLVLECDATNLVVGDTNAKRDIFLIGNPLYSGVTPDTSGSTESLNLTPLTDISLATRAGALAAMDRIRSKMEDVQTVEGTIGCYMSRMEVGIANLSSMSDNLQAAKSRIMDVDIAQESSELTRTQILQQAASAVLAQANQAPALALKLLS